MSCWVVDTSPLIFLSKLGRLDLLRHRAQKILVPRAVLTELQARPDQGFPAIEAALGSWLHLVEPGNRSSVDLLRIDLGAGEAEAIVIAREEQAEKIVMDDLDGRRYARLLGLQPVGTLGVLLAARLRGELASLAAEIERLRQLGFRASDALVRTVLETAGEVREE
jgi:hypothetical protein